MLDKKEVSEMSIENDVVVEQHSEEVQEIIGSVPHWLMRWGITLFFLVLLTVLLMSALIQSPEIVSGKLMINSENRPQEVIARKSGKLMRLFVTRNAEVKSGQILAFMESTANHSEVLRLSGFIDRLQGELLNFKYDMVDTASINTIAQYGELQPAFQQFYLSLLQFKGYTRTGINSKKISVIKNEINNLKRLEMQLARQKEINRADHAIQQREFEAFKKLAEAKVISPLEFKREESKFLNKMLPIESSESALINNLTSQTLKEKELLEAESAMAEQRAAFLGKVQQFKSEIDRWKFENLLVSDRDGKIVFHRLLEEKEWLEAHKPVMYVADENTGEQFGELVLGQYSLGKVRNGQDVLIKLKAYPYQEFGMLRGKITYISNVLYGDTNYTAKVKLPGGLRTTYNKLLTLQNGLIAEAEIVTESRSLLSRVLNALRSVIDNTN